ncbi:armadillo-type protein [Mycena vulgaris]|nr:armadillo-type protein [Mycena vulgaris]
MNSFTRQPTLDSVRSWWSDSNPTGPNINIHALAKPLMKLMYHRQALDYIAKHRDTLVSRENIEIYASYLRFKYVLSITKIAVLRDLIARVQSNDDVVAVADFISLFPCAILLEPRNANVQGWTCRLLGALANRRPGRTVTWLANVCKKLVSLLQTRDESENVRLETFLALWSIARNPKGAQALIDVHVLDGLAELVKSPNSSVRSRACDLLEALASQKVTVPASLVVTPCQQLVALLRGENRLIMQSALAALYWITKLPEGMQAAIDAKLLDHVAELLESRMLHTQKWMCKMLAAHDGMLATLVGRMHCKQLASFLYLEHNVYAAEALRWISKSPEGAQAVVDAGVLKSVNSLLGLSGYVQREACKMLGALASHGSTVTAVLRTTPCNEHSDIWVRDAAVSALAQISEHPEGVAAIAATNILGHVSTLMENRGRAMQFQTCIILRNLCRRRRRR